MFVDHISNSRIEDAKRRKNKPRYSKECEIDGNSKKCENQSYTSDSSLHYR